MCDRCGGQLLASFFDGETSKCINCGRVIYAESARSPLTNVEPPLQRSDYPCLDFQECMRCKWPDCAYAARASVKEKNRRDLAVAVKRFLEHKGYKFAQRKFGLRRRQLQRLRAEGALLTRRRLVARGGKYQ
jgi:tRNA/tmRNA/rRNA uracil-C5-methylase (TrmA/RlmC/RlmD family)